MSGGLGKEGFEARDDDLLDVFYETVQDPPGGQSLAESYVNHGAELHVHFGLRLPEAEAGQLCAIFERPEWAENLLLDGDGCNRVFRPHRERWDDDGVTVLVDAVDLPIVQSGSSAGITPWYG